MPALSLTTIQAGPQSSERGLERSSASDTPRAAPASIPAAFEAARARLALFFAIEGDLRFMAHHDVMRMLTRAFVRARLPVKYSQGFNPQPHISLPMPRPLGVASEAELAVVELTEPLSPAEARARIVAAMPEACRTLHVIEMPAAGTPHPVAVEYQTEIADADGDSINTRAAELLARANCVIQRDNGPKKPPRTFDIRPYIDTVALDGPTLRMRLRVTRNGTARPGEVLDALGLPAEEFLHKTRRVRVEWDMDLSGPPIDGPPIGKD